MKNLVFAFVLAFYSPTLALSQDADTTIWAYAEITGTAKPFSSKVLVEVDFGQQKRFFDGQAHLISDEKGKPITFNSMVDAMNHMGKLGWEFVQAYAYETNGQNVLHWLMRIKCLLGEQGQYIPLTRKEAKKTPTTGN